MSSGALDSRGLHLDPETAFILIMTVASFARRAVAMIVINALYSLNLDGWGEIVSEWLKAKGDPLKERRFITRRSANLSDVATSSCYTDILVNRRQKYASQVPDGVVYITGGIDSQTSGRYECYVGWGAEECWLIDKTIVLGCYDEEDTLQRVDGVIRKQYRRSDGTTIGVSRWAWISVV